MIKIRFLSSMAKIYSDKIYGTELEKVCGLKNETISFQMAYWSDEEAEAFLLKVESDLPSDLISIYKLGQVPLFYAGKNKMRDGFDRIDSCFCPDPLYHRKTVETISVDYTWSPYYFEEDERNMLYALPHTFQSLFFSINEHEIAIPQGEYHICIKLISRDNGEIITSSDFEIEIENAMVEALAPIYTNWFYEDCLADLYQVPMYSERHFMIMRSFIHKAVEMGMNMILMPAFTPLLDTMIGRNRRNTQLVLIEIKNGHYEFDFSLLIQFIEMCREEGIRYFEHSHLFSQWGARHCPAIYANVNGSMKQIVGWDTAADNPKYRTFLSQYIKELEKLLVGMKLKKKVFFHISDEPQEKDIESYEKAHLILKEIEPDMQVIDAMSCYHFYELGLVDIPIVEITSPDLIMFKQNCTHFWVYYTGGAAAKGYTNRLLNNSGACCRSLGLMMYEAGAEGFLHWGYNYYYDRLSCGLFNPFQNPNGYDATSGSSYIVYPDTDGTAVPSQRMKLMKEAFTDYRALKTLEKKIGREALIHKLNKQYGELTFNTLLTENEILELRSSINKELSMT